MRTETTPSPVLSPQSVAFGNSSLWITSAKTLRIYEADPQSLHVSRELVPPGEPFGLTVANGELHAVLGFGKDADDRYVYRLDGESFEARFACPDLSGSFLGVHDLELFLTQAHDKNVVTLDFTGNVLRSVALPRRPVGVTYANGDQYVVTADEDWNNREFSRIDPNGALETIGAFDFQARGLTFDGERFWTTHREANELVSFAI